MKNVYPSINEKSNISRLIFYILVGMFTMIFTLYVLVYISLWGLSILGILL